VPSQAFFEWKLGHDGTQLPVVVKLWRSLVPNLNKAGGALTGMRINKGPIAQVNLNTKGILSSHRSHMTPWNSEMLVLQKGGGRVKEKS
jgi:hypothetical protein